MLVEENKLYIENIERNTTLSLLELYTDSRDELVFASLKNKQGTTFLNHTLVNITPHLHFNLTRTITKFIEVYLTGSERLKANYGN